MKKLLEKHSEAAATAYEEGRQKDGQLEEKKSMRQVRRYFSSRGSAITSYMEAMTAEAVESNNFMLIGTKFIEDR